MKTIPLTQGKVALVDDEDFERVSQFKWYYTQAGYACRSLPVSGRKKTIQLMHRLIMGEPEGMEVDHRKHGDTLNNQKDNLRAATHQQNLCNRGKNRNNTSGHKGVSWNKLRGKWMAQIKHGYKNRYLGLFTDIQDAISAYATAAKQLHGEFART